MSGCRKETNPKDVTILFWMALSENKWDKAKKYSTEGSAALFDKKRHYISLQVGKVDIDYDVATVETIIIRESAVSRSSFKTYLVRTPKTNIWKVDYPKTVDNMNNEEFKNLFKILKKTTKEKIDFLKAKEKSIRVKIKNWLRKQLD